jgi:diguanylate cyclase (GGDEF)-like protein/PAS domain S-box-containing protein
MESNLHAPREVGTTAGAGAPTGAVVVIDAEHRVISVSAVASALLAIDAGAARGVPVSSLIVCDPLRLVEGDVVRATVGRGDGTPVPIDVLVCAGVMGRTLTLSEVGLTELVHEARGVMDLAFDNTPMCAALINAAGEYIRVNDNLCRLLGRTREQLLGKRDQQFTHPDDRAADLEWVERILRGELDTATLEKRFVRPDGTPVWTIANLTFLRDEQRKPICWIGQFQDVTERHLIEERLRDRERQLAEAQAIAQVGSWAWDGATDTIEWSDELCRLLGRPPGQPPADYAEYLDCIHPDDRDHLRGVIERSYATGEPYVCEYRVIWPDGSVRRLHARGKLEAGADGQPRRMLGSAQDVTEARRVQLALEDSERLLSAGFDGAAIGMAVVSPEGRWLRVNRALRALTGYSEEQLLRGSFADITHPDDLASDEALLARTLAGEIPGYELEKRYIHADGSIVWTHLSVTLVRDEHAEPRYFVSQVQDIGERKRHEGELRRLAEHDPLTDLLNHRSFRERLGFEVERAEAEGRTLSLVLLDLDDFKQVNDRHGHPAGDTALREIARMLAELARDGDALARVGGEEFAWIVPDSDGAGAWAAAERARRAISGHRSERGLRVTISGGVCELAEAADAEQLYARADEALYWAKQYGRNRTFRYTPEAAAELAPRGPAEAGV